ncbi:MAG: DUF2723 domain-containing protein [Polyangiales bacterium]
MTGLAHPRSTWSAAALLGVYYLATMTRDMSLLDSPELALVATQGGVGHPIGQPLHTLLGHVLVRLGGAVGVSPLLCLNGLSAVACALTLVPVTWVLEQHVPATEPRQGALRPWLIALCGVHAALWEPATRVEVYPLGTLLGATSVALLGAALHSPPRGARLPMACAGLSVSLAAGANAVSATFFLVAMAPQVGRALVTRRLSLRALAPAVAAAVLGLLVWAYVPLAARDPDVVAWGRPVDWPALRAYLQGEDYSGKSVAFFSTDFAAHVAAFGEWGTRNGLLAIIGFGLLGTALRARPILPLTCILLLANTSWYARYDPFAPGLLDYLGYLGAPLWFLAGGCALLVEWAADRGRVVHAVAGTTLALVTLLAPPAPWQRTRSGDHVTRTLTTAALDELPRDAVLLVEADHWVGPLLYLQEVERHRPDVVVLALGLASSSWMWELLYRRHPGLQPFVLRAPGGRDARVRRFLAAQPTRRVFANDPRLAARVGRPSCVSGVLSELRACGPEAIADRLSPLLAAAHRALGAGSPGTTGLLGWEAETRARALAAEGRARDAFVALTVSAHDVSRDLIPERVPPFELPGGPTPDDGFGSTQRCLLLAAALARRAQQPGLGEQLEAAAADAPR